MTKLIDYQQFCGIPQPQPEAIVEGDIDPTEVKAKIDRGDNFVLIDVREPHEYQICSIPSARLIPLGQLPQRLDELDRDIEIVAHCKSGMRSAKAVGILKAVSYTHLDVYKRQSVARVPDGGRQFRRHAMSGQQSARALGGGYRRIAGLDAGAGDPLKVLAAPQHLELRA